MNGRGERIRTSDLSVPNRAHYQAVLRPELITAEKADEHSIGRQTSGQVPSIPGTVALPPELVRDD
jgi:hypothetical protein